MRQKLLTIAGVLALLAVLGKYYAQPVLAQVRAALVQDVENPAHFPVRFSGNLSIGPGGAVSENSVGTAIPLGKRLVLEFATGRCTAVASPGVDVSSIEIRANENVADAVQFHFYDLAFTRVADLQGIAYYISQPIRLYSDGTRFNNTLGFSARLTNSVPANGTVSCSIELSGYTVTLP